MRRADMYAASVFLSAALAVPLVVSATVLPQDDKDRERHEQQERNQRVYDPVYRDYHNWDQGESSAYHQWFDERHEQYRDYTQLNSEQQQAYWRWRHEHEKHDDRDHH